MISFSFRTDLTIKLYDQIMTHYCLKLAFFAEIFRYKQRFLDKLAFTHLHDALLGLQKEMINFWKSNHNIKNNMRGHR